MRLVIDSGVSDLLRQVLCVLIPVHIIFPSELIVDAKIAQVGISCQDISS
jgi:hypothetical protein